MLTEGQTILFYNPFASLGPGLAIVLLAVSVNLIGDWLYEWRSVAAERREVAGAGAVKPGRK